MRKQVLAKFLTETDGALRYREIDRTGTHIHNDRDGTTVGDIYVRKAAMPGARPDQIKVTIEYESDENSKADR